MAQVTLSRKAFERKKYKLNADIINFEWTELKLTNFNLLRLEMQYTLF